MRAHLLSALLLTSSFSIYADSSSHLSTDPLTIFGAYQTQTTMAPLILQADQQGVWQQMQDIAQLPAGMNSLNVTNTDCSDFACVAVGTYTGSGKVKLTHGILLTSTDQITWQNIDQVTGLTNDSLSKTSGYLLHTKCDTTACIATGYLNNTDHSPLLPLLLATQGSPNNWQAINVNGMPAMKMGYLSDIAMTGNNAIVLGGYYYQQDDWQPLMLLSHDHGTTWSVNQSISGLPKNYVDFSLVQCVNNHCVIAARDVIDANVTKPAFLTSDDSGETWQYVSDVKLPSDLYNGNIFTLHCQGTSCLAVGNYFKSQKDQVIPLVMTSTDLGKTWTTVNSPVELPLDAIQMTPVSISCVNDATCLIEANYITEANENDKPQAYPLLFIASLNDGAWRLNRADGNLATLNSLILISAACSNGSCGMVGAFKQLPNSTDYSPVIFTSDDLSGNWKIASPLRIPSSSYFDLIA